MIRKKRYIKIGVGIAIIIVSVFTPFTNAFLIPLSLFIMGVSLRDIEELKRKIKNKFRGL